MICMKPLRYFAEKDAPVRFKYIEAYKAFRKAHKKAFRCRNGKNEEISLYSISVDVDEARVCRSILSEAHIDFLKVYEEQRENRISNRTIIKKVIRIIAKDFLHKKNPNAYARFILKQGRW